MDLLLELEEEVDINGCCCGEGLIGVGECCEGGNNGLYVLGDEGCGVSYEIIGNIVVRGEEITSPFAGKIPVLRGAVCGDDDGDVRGELTTVTIVVHVVCVGASAGIEVD